MTGTTRFKARAGKPAASAMPTHGLALAAMLVVVAALGTAMARAETVVIDDQVTVRESDIARPAGGMTMKAVEAKFGAPQERHEAVGKPPITRWDYQGFAVFFEHDRVIHAVVTPAS